MYFRISIGSSWFDVVPRALEVYPMYADGNSQVPTRPGKDDGYAEDLSQMAANHPLCFSNRRPRNQSCE
jgi:hypothetical protein